MQAKVSRYQGENAELSCIISGYEKPIMYFAKDNYQVQQDITNHKKYMYNSAKVTQLQLSKNRICIVLVCAVYYIIGFSNVIDV